jgi:regulator of protease activity HflC (stomatin/prohibitin superfamily)
LDPLFDQLASLLPLLFLVGLAYFLITRWIVNVGATQIAITERRYLGKGLDANRAFAMDGQVGIEAAYLAPGLKFIPWPIVRVIQKKDFTVVGPNQLGIVTATDGAQLPAGRIFSEDLAGEHHDQFQNPEAFLRSGGVRGEQLRFLTNGQFKLHPRLFAITLIEKTYVPQGQVGIVSAGDGQMLSAGDLVGRSVQGHDNFQKAEVFLKNGGQKGPQVDILRPGTYNIHTGIFKVEIRQAISIGDGQIGIVEALGGEAMNKGDVVADSPEGHNNFQDGEAFLKNGGRRGPQTAILAPGTYYINTALFAVSNRPQTVVQQGQVAVLISNHGTDPSSLAEEITSSDSVSGQNSGPVEGQSSDPEETRLNTLTRTRHVVPSGYRGIQKDVLGPGRYNINPLVNQIVIVPTTTRSVEWAGSPESQNARKSAGNFDPFEVVSNDGFPMKVEVRCQYRVLPENAPYVIAKLGSIEELEKNVIDPQIDGIFRAEVSKSPAISYQQKRAEEQKKAQEEVRADLAKYRVEVVSVMITNIHLPPALMETTQKKNLAEQQRSMYDEQQKTEGRRIELEKTRAQADNQARIIEAESGILVAEHKASQKVKEADGEAKRIERVAEAEAKRIKQTGDAEAGVIESKGRATAEAYRLGGEALTPAGLTAVEVIKSIAQAGLQITPNVQVNGGGEGGAGNGLVQLLLADLVQRSQIGVSNPDKPNQ